MGVNFVRSREKWFFCSPGHGRPPASHPKLRRVQLRPGQAPAGSLCELWRRHQGRATAAATHARPGMVAHR
jgi:hypothetical protein